MRRVMKDAEIFSTPFEVGKLLCSADRCFRMALEEIFSPDFLIQM
ncbi:MAG: hypothetical protein H6Q19_2280 [Bacteroidetes bacterium]|nr:hypothetical protein [Bacteroidota bacterium]